MIFLIDTYKIEKVNGEDQLFIYLNFDYEFASFDLDKKKKKKKNLTKMVKEYIKKNNIMYKGTIVSLICGGIFLGTINLNSIHNNSNNKQLETKEIILKEELKETPLKEDVVIEVIEEQPKQEEIVTDIKGKNDTSKKVVEKEKNVNNISNDKKENTKVFEEPAKEESVKQVIVEEIPKETEIDNKTYVNVKRSNGTIKLELEEYLIGVVGSEMPASFHIEALKAQAVVARTYALNAISKGKILTDNSSTQQYKNNEELRSMWQGSFDTYYKKIKSAVDSTKGEYLTYNGKFIDAVYHSTSNGRTEDAKNVWGYSIPYLVSVDSPYDNLNPSYEKTVEVSYTDLSNKIKLEFNSDTIIKLNGSTEGNRVSFIQIGENVYTGVDFRNLLGLRSADFDIEKKENSLFITTHGYGHGVGMSQYGANGMAKNGSNYKQILFHYYNGVKLTK